jgi:Chromosome segregation ATPases
MNNQREYILNYEKEIQEIDSKIVDITAQRQLMENELVELQENQRKTDREIGKIERDLEEDNRLSSNFEKELINHKDNQIEFMRKITELKNKITSIRINYENIEKRQEGLEAQAENYRSSLAINATTIEALNMEKEKISKEISEHEYKAKELKKEFLGINKLISDKDNVLKDLTQKNHKAEANYNLLLNLEKNFEGYNRAVKALMSHIEEGKIPEMKGKTYLLGNIIKVPDGLESAIEIALGSAVSDIITHDDGTAKKLINYLKSNSLGRATFLPLNIIEGKKIRLNDEVIKTTGFKGIASDLVQYDNLFQSAVNHVLGRTIICDTMDNALIIAKKISYSYRIVTLLGDVVNPGGSLTGGSQQYKGSNVLGRKRELRDLNEKIGEFKRDIKFISDEINNLKVQQSDLDNTILNEKDLIHSKQIEITKIHGKISAIIEDTEKLKANLKITLQESQSIELKRVS